jgi:hypothetical protein
VPFLELQGVLELNPLEVVEVYQDEELVHMWLAVKIRPLLRSVSKHFLACLSTKNFSCTTYQGVQGLPLPPQLRDFLGQYHFKCDGACSM